MTHANANMTPISGASLWKLWTQRGGVKFCKYREMYQIQNTFLARALRCFKSCLKRLESRDILSINIIVHWQHSNYKPASSGLISSDKTRRRFDERPSGQKVQTMFFINPTIALKRACSSPSAGNAKRHRCTCSRVSSQRERAKMDMLVFKSTLGCVRCTFCPGYSNISVSTIYRCGKCQCFAICDVSAETK